MLFLLPTKLLSPVLLMTHLVVIAAFPVGFTPISGHRSRGLKHFSSETDLKPENFVGFHYAPRGEAEEYNKARTLTAATVIEQNPYAVVYPKRGSFSNNYWECQIHVPHNEQRAIDEVPKLFIPNNAVPPGSQEELDEYIEKKELEPAKTVLFRQAVADVVEMLIPSRYLEKSPSNQENPSGENSLSLKVSCHPPSTPSGSESLKANWPIMWSILHWPASLII
ncbi:hypothetical protein F5879DRAFT_1003867 [Lentinula edodes]|uniref:uncharacterized protein n=1 Tax=Lentinula edodes TaxID=5353 RepID=UPI001E8E5C93|nr:uncharacterized protein C8R40DRAFT_1095044 [Lentinula edodes]KAH7877753.1 hypothetical protein C8R40DRAFT_1095044 [Lentinula edodes]KAJ3901439.1 hypothetical protein F5879DRAFT_1003867 [Lentinula edodes]